MPSAETIARNAMVDEQLIARGIQDEAVLDAMRRVPRHVFLPDTYRAHAYEDRPIPIGTGQTISQPYMVALMTATLDLTPADRVLEIGTGSGYQGAILATLAREVFTIERHAQLAQRARDTFNALGIRNITVIEGDGSAGLPAHAPYDAIIVTAGGPRVPKPLMRQLAIGGRLVCPAGDRTLQRLYKVTREADGYRTTTGIKCVFVPLVGDEGWKTAEADSDDDSDE